MEDVSIQSIRCYEHLVNYCPKRNAVKVTEEFLNATAYIKEAEILLCRMNLLLGKKPPSNHVDESIRNCFAESFDSLLCAKNLIYEGYVGTGFPMMRRGYEFMEMIIYFHLKPEEVKLWRQGKQIQQGEIRKFLETHTLGGDVKMKKELYSYFSEGSHTNYILLLHRQLGTTNQFTLGNFVNPNRIRTMEYLMRLVQLYGFLRHIIFIIYKNDMLIYDADLETEVARVSDEWGTKINEEIMSLYREAYDELEEFAD